MSDILSSILTPTTMESETEKPVSEVSNVELPPFPEPTDNDFDEDISEEERKHYKSIFSGDLSALKSMRLHCTACDRHLGSSVRNESKMRMHPMLRTLVCNTCHSFYNSGEFDKGDDGSELYCRWCGQGGQVYCCSNCPHVFCAKCIKRNFGMPKIREIENTDDWQCFKCKPDCLWDHRAMCWALLRYCDVRNKLIYKTSDPKLKLAYEEKCAVDETECCRNKLRRKEKEIIKKKDNENVTKKPEKRNSTPSAEKKSVTPNTTPNSTSIISKIPPTIQVKKFASINLDQSPKEKKPQKRSISPKSKVAFVNLPINLPKLTPNFGVVPPPAKKIRLPGLANAMVNPIRLHKDRMQTYRPSPRPKAPMFTSITHRQPPPLYANNMNGYNSGGMYGNPYGDNINLSLESLTQGLDFSSMAQQPLLDNNVVCTPDFPLEPLCEVAEENTDDDVQCITPQIQAANSVPPIIPKPKMSDISMENIIQMTENDVTVNAVTGGLKFRVDPQTLSSNKMYRLPDGRVFAINVNPNMPGGYSATIVAVADKNTAKTTPKGPIYSAKLSAVTSSQKLTSPSMSTANRNRVDQPSSSNKRKQKITKSKEPASVGDRICDMTTPVEWFRFSLIDATGSLEYSLNKLQKMKKEATTAYLRTRNVEEMRSLYDSLNRVLNTSLIRFTEIKDNIKNEFKLYLSKKSGNSLDVDDDDDDDVEILNEIEDDPIFIDENSMDSSIANVNETQEVDLTDVPSEHNESGENQEKLTDNSENAENNPEDVLKCHEDSATITEVQTNCTEENNREPNTVTAENSIENNDSNAENKSDEIDGSTAEDNIPCIEKSVESNDNIDDAKPNGSIDSNNGDGNDDGTPVDGNDQSENGDKQEAENKEKEENDSHPNMEVDNESNVEKEIESVKEQDSAKVDEKTDNSLDENKVMNDDLNSQDVEMSDELIDSLFYSDGVDPKTFLDDVLPS